MGSMFSKANGANGANGASGPGPSGAQPEVPQPTPGEGEDGHQVKLDFADFAAKLITEVTCNEVHRICLFADPDLDGLSSMYALARAMHQILKPESPNKSIECYQMCNHDRARGEKLTEQLQMIASSEQQSTLAVFLDISPMREDNKTMMRPTNFRHVFVIDEHEKDLSEITEDQHITVCESVGYAAAGMVYKILEAGVQNMPDFSGMWDVFKAAWLHRLSVANYTDNGCKLVTSNSHPDATKVVLLDSTTVEAADDYAEQTSVPFCSLWKLKALALFESHTLDRASGEIKLLELDLGAEMELFAITGTLQDIEKDEDVLCWQTCFDTCTAFLQNSGNWHVVTSSNFDVDFCTDYVVMGVSLSAMENATRSVADADKHSVNVMTYDALCASACNEARVAYHFGICDTELKKCKNNLSRDKAAHMFEGTGLWESVCDRNLRVFVMYIDEGDGSALVCRAGGGINTNCVTLAQKFGGNGRPWTAGCGGLDVKITQDGKWSIEKMQA